MEGTRRGDTGCHLWILSIVNGNPSPARCPSGDDLSTDVSNLGYVETNAVIYEMRRFGIDLMSYSNERGRAISLNL
jgi:hypothetical protein